MLNNLFRKIWKPLEVGLRGFRLDEGVWIRIQIEDRYTWIWSTWDLHEGMTNCLIGVLRMLEKEMIVYSDQETTERLFVVK
jgi:hypothetical protein